MQSRKIFSAAAQAGGRPCLLRSNRRIHCALVQRNDVLRWRCRALGQSYLTSKYSPHAYLNPGNLALRAGNAESLDHILPAHRTVDPANSAHYLRTMNSGNCSRMLEIQESPDRNDDLA